MHYNIYRQDVPINMRITDHYNIYRQDAPINMRITDQFNMVLDLR